MSKPRVAPSPDIQIVPFSGDTRLSNVLKLQSPAFVRRDPFCQLAYIELYVRKLGCRVLLIEGHYVDRDYIEDHSLFYSRSFLDYTNSCRRVHFFRTAPDELQPTLARLEGLCGQPDKGGHATEWDAFSRDDYIGFVVIKPLHGSPVGRTILRCFDTTTTEADGAVRAFPTTRRYPVHLGALELQVAGLPFQQQDVGVSACARPRCGLRCTVCEVRRDRLAYPAQRSQPWQHSFTSV
jgi:hypothetical protein